MGMWQKALGCLAALGVVAIVGLFFGLEKHYHDKARLPESPDSKPLPIPPEGIKVWFSRAAAIHRQPTDESPVLRKAKEGEAFTYEALEFGWARERGGTAWADLRDLTSLKPLSSRDRAQQEAQKRREAAAERAAAEPIRRTYAKQLREEFLDKGLDIKVQVAGQRADRIKFEYVLANAVWAHRFKKDGVIDRLRELGFERVDLEDGYDYHVYWNLR